MFNIVDLPQKISYTEKEFKDLNDFEISVNQQSLNFIGNPRKNRYIPGYVFKVKAESDFKNLQQVLTKCVFEAQNKASAEKAEDYDEDFLGRQLAGDFSSASQVDVQMSDADDYSFTNERSAYNAQQEHRELQRLLNRMDQSVIMEDPNEDRGASKRKTDKQGNYRYYSDSDEDY